MNLKIPPPIQLSVEEFIRLRDIIHRNAGIFFETKKIYFVKKRLQKRMQALSLTTPGDYFNHLTYNDKAGTELQALLNLMTTNETYFFRENTQLTAFRDHVLPLRLAEKEAKNNYNLRIWSAGCSSGEEPYTLALMLKELLGSNHRWRIEILANDIDTDILKKAMEGVYDNRSVRHVPPVLLKKYFSGGDNAYRIDDSVRQYVRFRHFSLKDGGEMRNIRHMDFIFCRNVMIYFDDPTRKAVCANFYDCLDYGGYIFLGHSECVTRFNSAFQTGRAGNFVIHYKPGQSQEVARRGSGGIR